MSTLVGTAVRRTDSAKEARVGMPDSRDSREEREASSADSAAASEGELPASVGKLPRLVVAAAWGIGSASANAAKLRRRTSLRNIAAWLFASNFDTEEVDGLISRESSC